jgi:hypothetical protein
MGGGAEYGFLSYQLEKTKKNRILQLEKMFRSNRLSHYSAHNAHSMLK